MKTKRILIADDDHESRELLSKLAIRAGYDAVGAKDGAELVTLCATSRFDLIITDLVMAHIHGALAVETLREQGCSVPVIAVTGRSCHEIKNRGDLFIKIFHKPFILKELLACIESVIGK